VAYIYSLPTFGQAQEVHQELQEIAKAQVIEVVKEYERDITGTGASTTVQELRIQLKDGEKAGEVVSLENDSVILSKGDKIFVNRIVMIDGSEHFSFKDVERRAPLATYRFNFLCFNSLAVWKAGGTCHY
jgi:uncharacterized membrane protein